MLCVKTKETTSMCTYKNKILDAVRFAESVMSEDVLNAVTRDYAADHGIYDAINRLREVLADAGVSSGKRPYTVLLLRPDHMSDSFGQDTFCAHVEGGGPGEALEAAREAACGVDGAETPEDYHCLFCAEGFLMDLSPETG